MDYLCICGSILPMYSVPDDVEAEFFKRIDIKIGEALDQYRDSVLEMIGEDEVVPEAIDPLTATFVETVLSNNRLKQELRNKLKKI